MKARQFHDHCKDLRRTGGPVPASTWPRIVIVQGDDSVQREAAITALKDLHPDLDAHSYRFDVRDGLEPSWQEECYTLPLGAAGKLIHIRCNGKWLREQKADLAEYAESPSESAVLLLESDHLNKTDRKAMPSGPVTEVLCAPPEAEELPQWIAKAAGRRGKTIDRDASQLLAEFVGSDTGLLETQLDQLALHAGSKKTIDLESVASFVQDRRDVDVFKFASAVVTGDTPAAMDMYKRMVSGGGSVFNVIGTLGWKLRELIPVCRLRDSGCSEREISSELNVPFYRLKHIMREIQGRSAEDLARMHRVLVDVDEQIKTGLLPEEYAGELMIVRLAEFAA